MKTGSSEDGSEVQQQCDVDESLARSATVRGWGLDAPGMSGYDRTEKALMTLAGEVQRLREGLEAQRALNALQAAALNQVSGKLAADIIEASLVAK